jgi:predicted alpha/beta superfamily hydrolase
LWANKVTKNFSNAVKKAVYKCKSNKIWNKEYIINANEGYGTVFFIDANNVPEAKTELVKALQHSSVKNIYYFGINSKKMLDGIINK